MLLCLETNDLTVHGVFVLQAVRGDVVHVLCPSTRMRG